VAPTAIFGIGGHRPPLQYKKKPSTLTSKVLGSGDVLLIREPPGSLTAYPWRLDRLCRRYPVPPFSRDYAANAAVVLE